MFDVPPSRDPVTGNRKVSFKMKGRLEVMAQLEPGTALAEQHVERAGDLFNGLLRPVLALAPTIVGDDGLE